MKAFQNSQKMKKLKIVEVVTSLGLVSSGVFFLRFAYPKRGCVLPMVIWPAFRMGQYRVNDHPYHAPQFNLSDSKLTRVGYHNRMKPGIHGRRPRPEGTV